MIKKALLYFLIFISTTSCKEKSDIFDVLENSSFTTEEKNDIVKLVDFFESKLNINNKSDINEAYRSLIITYTDEGNINFIQEKLNYKEQLNLIEDKETNTYKEIWIKSKGNHEVINLIEGTPVTDTIYIELTTLNTDGKYMDWLNKFGKSNDKIFHYSERIREIGDLPPFYNILQGLIMDIDGNWTEDLSKPEWRIIIAIHFLDYNLEYNEYNSIKN